MKSCSQLQTRTRFLCIYGNFSAWSFFTVAVGCTCYAYVIGAIIQRDLERGFLAEAESNLASILAQGSELVGSKFDQLVANFVGPMTVAFEDAYRSDYPFEINGIPSYYNWPGNLPNARFNENYAADITYDSSSINVFATSIFNFSNLEAIVRDHINRTASMDLLFIPALNSTPEFLAGYIADVSAKGSAGTIKRYYPGRAPVNMSQVPDFVNFDGTTRSWYKHQAAQVKVTSPSAMAFSAPYFDAINKQLMITVGRMCYNVYQEQNGLLGGFGADLVLTELQLIVGRINYLGQTRTLLFDVSSGSVLSDSSSPKIASLLTYANLSNPAITATMWSELLRSQSRVISNGDYDMMSRFVQGRFLLVAIIRHSYVLDTFSSISSAEAADLEKYIYIVVGLAAIFLLITVISTIAAIKRLIDPLQRLEDRSKNLVRRFGTKYTESDLAVDEDTGTDELRRANQEFRRALAFMAKPSNDSGDSMIDNPCQGLRVTFPELSRRMLPAAVAVPIDFKPSN